MFDHTSSPILLMVLRLHINMIKLLLHFYFNHYSHYSLFTAIHSLRSSPSGNITASRRLPLPSVAAACFIKSYWCVPSGIFFFGLKVLLLRPPLKQTKITYMYVCNAEHKFTFHKGLKYLKVKTLGRIWP